MKYLEKTTTILKNLRDIKIYILAHNEKLLLDGLVTHGKYTFFTPITSLILGIFSLVVFFIAFVRLHGQKNKIQSSEMLLQNIVQSTDNIMNYYEPIQDANGNVTDFKIIFANICNKDYLDLEPDDIVGKPISVVYPFVLKNKELGQMIDCYHNNDTIDFERQVNIKGTSYRFHTFIRAMDKGLLEVARNNTEEYNAKENLLYLNNTLEIQNFIMSQAKRMAKIGSYIWNYKSDKAEISDNFYRILDCEPGAFDPFFETYRDFVHPEDRKQYDEMGRMIKDKQELREHTYRIVTKKGNIKYLRTKGQLVKRDGESVMIGVVQDISELLKAENDLKVKNQELKRNNMELEAFNRVASHDLQEPLRKIQMFISRIDNSDRTKLSEKGMAQLDKIDQVAARMQSLIRNLLTYAYLNKKNEIFEKVDLNQVLKKIREDYSEQINEVDGRIISQKLVEVNGIFFQLEQLLGNLILNSIKYRTPNLPPVIEIIAEIVSREEIPLEFVKLSRFYHKISVSDNGIGFDNAYVNKIFEVFQRLHPNTEYTGTGIGLAICKKIVENHRGHIHAQSILGKGSIFTIYLPA
jgi:signal transduction histidine kinase